MRDLGERELPGMSPGRVYELIGPAIWANGTAGDVTRPRLQADRPVRVRLTSRVLIPPCAVSSSGCHSPLPTWSSGLQPPSNQPKPRLTPLNVGRSLSIGEGNDLGGVSWSLPCLKRRVHGTHLERAFPKCRLWVQRLTARSQVRHPAMDESPGRGVRGRPALVAARTAP